MTFKKGIVGKNGEDLATNFLKEKGFLIIERNFSTKYGELDIVATKDNKIHFIEVKARNSLQKGLPHEAVRHRKLDHLKKAIQIYLLQKPIKGLKLSLDVISILLDRTGGSQWIKHFENIHT